MVQKTTGERDLNLEATAELCQALGPQLSAAGGSRSQSRRAAAPAPPADELQTQESARPDKGARPTAGDLKAAAHARGRSRKGK